MSTSDAYVQGLRDIVAAEGVPMLPDNPGRGVFEWRDVAVLTHAQACGAGWGALWQLPAGVDVFENDLSAAGTGGVVSEVGFEVDGASCRCGQHSGLRLRWVGSVTDALKKVLTAPDATGTQLIPAVGADVTAVLPVVVDELNLDPIRERLSAAPARDSGWQLTYGPGEKTRVWAADDDLDPLVTVEGFTDHGDAARFGDFVTHSASDIEALIGEVERLRAELRGSRA